MAYCNNCGTELSASQASCQDCGNSVESGVAADTASGEKVVYAGGALSIVGAFLPWVTFLGYSFSGIDGDGIITLILGIAAIGVVYAREWDRTTNIALLAMGALVAVIALSAVTNFAGSGIYVTILGGILVAYPGAKELVS